MSLQRQLLVIFLSTCCLFFAFKAGFLTIERFLIIPSNSPLQVQAQEADASQAAQVAEADAPVVTKKQLPTRIMIPGQNIDLPITPNVFLNGNWQISTNGVSLLDTTFSRDPNPGFVLYGHNWPVLLGGLQRVKIGQPIVLNYADGSQENYTIQSVFKVAPDKLSVLDLAKSQTLLLYTCTGFMDSQRLVVLAQFNN